MNFCSKCGAQIQDGKMFCTNCGQPVPVNNTEYAPPATDINAQNAPQQAAGGTNYYTPQGAPVVNSKPKMTLSKAQLKIILGVAAALVLCLAFYFVGASVNSKDKAVAKITAAIQSNDAAKLSKYVVCSDPKLKIDAKTLEGLVNYLNKTPSFKNEIIDSIKKQASDPISSSKLSKETKELAALATGTSNSFFTLKTQGKAWLFFNKYVLELKPVYIKVSTNFKDTQVFLGDTLVCTADKDNFTKEIGPFAPGLYKLKAALKGQFGDIEKAVDIDAVGDLDSSDKGQLVINTGLDLDVGQVSVNCDDKDAELFVNGKDTGMKIKDVKKIGPIATDGSAKMYVQKDFPWGTIKGEEAKVDGSYVDLELSGMDEASKAKVMDAEMNYSKSWIEALKAKDASKMASITEKKKAEQTEKIKTLIDNKQVYTGSITKIVFDYDYFRVSQNDGKYYVQVLYNESRTEALYNEGKEVAAAPVEYPLYTTLQYDEASKSWLVDSVTDAWNFSPKNTKEFKN